MTTPLPVHCLVHYVGFSSPLRSLLHDRQLTLHLGGDHALSQQLWRFAVH